ncbi:hypothetical protein DICPUDRAFT_33968 [Dictyostelium purpureum]|uniref:DNA polymerase n=1 Tax=Dictyostelium purpureum TaxID=5786 RepID=F0ZLU7_DICPU|nr:uncharacterized protein DICPUDRAFT_33968 [Dictyostelium purpureum]EGC35076.1 hypothetical protein DICPUDRAFT_33968 [Dictyostelium purpureum]|eukprot:XP_003288383.1 hypothetical protein DICPUDRAFT_33968 [Dictyostelium purpureum]
MAGKRKDKDNSSSDDSSSEDDIKKKKLKTNTPLIKVSVTSNDNKNKQLTDILTELSVFEKNKGQVHRFTAYRKAVLSIKAYPHEIKSGLEAQKLDGVGAKIAKKIDEILKTGDLKKLKSQNQDETLTAINQLSRVTGIGPQKAKSLVEEGIKTIDDLKKIKNTLTHHQQIGLKYFSEFEQRVPRKEIEVFEKLVSNSLFSIDPNIISQVCGSYRRGLESSGDIDILISHPNFTLEMKDKKKTFNIIEKLVESLKKKHILIDDLSLGPLKYMGVCKLVSTEISEQHIARRIDFKLIPYESYYFGLLHNTGSDEFNRQMRGIALKQGFTLSEYSINKLSKGVKNETPILVNSEKEIFDIIGMEYYPPNKRNL